MAAISERSGRYFVRVRRKGFPTVSKTFTRRTDAAAWARRVESDMESSRWRPHQAPTPTFREVVREYRELVAPRMRGAATYRYRFDEFEALPFASSPIANVRPADIALWRDSQAIHLRPGTVVRKLAMLSSIFTWALREREWISVNPAAVVSRPRVADCRSRTLSQQEIDWLLRAARTSKAMWLPAALTVLMSSAMRRSELCRLRREDLDLDRAVVRLAETKNGSPRAVPLCPEALQALRTLASAAEIRGDARVLPIGESGSLSTRFKVTVRRAIAMYRTDCLAQGFEPQAGFLADLRLHDLRHHAVTRWANTGALSLVELMVISGHKTTRMLTRYTHLNPQALALKLAQLSTRGG